MKFFNNTIFLISFLISPVFLLSQEKLSDKSIGSAINGLSFRSIGPAYMSGRIADIAIDSSNENIWYVAVGSGGLWKTTNAGTTWNCITEKQPFYSTGSVTLDPSNSQIVWLGTGENVGGRHVGIGHGIYYSSNGGKNWISKGLEKSEHISKIIVHPTDSDIIWVAAQGPLWSSGGERGLYKSTDGGKSWKQKIVGLNEWTGVTDILIDPRNPNILYAASWQRHRNVAAYIGGGPGTAIYKSLDGGETWKKLKSGLPSGNVGKIGLAISPINPDVIYAAIELERRKGGIYRSENLGESWTKMSNTVSGGTGPHYYQELIPSPHVFDKIFLMNNYVLISEDGGKTFYQMNESQKHVDSHALVFKQDDPNYVLFGTDGGLYESFDDTKSWKYVSNLPVTQFYKLAVDDSYPFYNVYGGTQDNNTQGGPSGTFKSDGISNSDWYVVLGGDGHQPATEPGNPNIIYSQSQEGNIYRIDKTNMETTYIKPQNSLGEDYERFNWDSPILVSSHDPKRLYFGSQRLWRSENRGDSWQAISKDLTKNEERLSLPIMGRKQSWDNAWDVYAMSTYNTITSVSESSIDDDIIFIGTDDGLVQSTFDGGSNWIKTPVSKLPGVPETSFVNDIKTDLFDKKVAYVALDNHKFGDYSPYLFKTTNGGKSWKSISNGIPDGTLIWRIVQDFVNPLLMFAGTEYGVYVSLNGGNKWHKLSNGMPTIPVRDLAIQKRESDLVAATFGRGFYILDNYSPLREISDELLENDFHIFEIEDALQYSFTYGGTRSQGNTYFTSKNPPYGATITYYNKSSLSTLKSERKRKESKLNKENKDVPFPGWDYLDKEESEESPKLFFEISDSNGKVVSRVSGKNSKGINRVSWGLTSPSATTIDADYSRSRVYFRSYRVEPGDYYVQAFNEKNGIISALSNKKPFNVERIREGSLKNPIPQDKINEYTENLSKLYVEYSVNRKKLENSKDKIGTLSKVSSYFKENKQELSKEIFSIRERIRLLEISLDGYETKDEIDEKDNLSLSSRLSVASRGVSNSYGPTKMHIQSFKQAKKLLENVISDIIEIEIAVDKLVVKAENSGSPKILD